MKIKKLISSLLLVVMVITSLLSVLPITASAVYISPEASNTKSENEVKKIVEEFLAREFATAEEMLENDKQKGYLVSVNSSDDQYTLYINQYTGVAYYVNNLTGQILTSNPTNVKNYDNYLLSSQISITYFENASPTVLNTRSSAQWAALRSQIKVSYIANGIRVNYSIGDTTARYLAPGRITAADFEDHILRPLLDSFKESIVNHIGDLYDETDLDFYENTAYEHEKFGCTDIEEVNKYVEDMLKLVKAEAPDAYKEIELLGVNSIQKLLRSYKIHNPEKEQYYIDFYKDMGADDSASTYEAALETMYKNYPTTKPVEDGGLGLALYELTGSASTVSTILKRNCSGYSYSDMYADEAVCEYKASIEQKPVFRVAIEYTFDADGALSVRVPSNSITYDGSVYTIQKVTPLQYFGAADMTSDGYAFYPDGSGSIIEFEDFYNSNAKINFEIHSDIYGSDYVYSQISGTNRAQITMPIYGIVNKVPVNASTTAHTSKQQVTNGFLAILEQGSSLATLSALGGGNANRFMAAYASYSPYPQDVVDLSETSSVSGVGSYTMTSETKYTGSYVTKYIMLFDEDVGNSTYGEGNYYSASYADMANCYRDYLYGKGILSDIDIESDDLPLYIEAFGSMEILQKIFSFPIMSPVALTSFDDIQTMYKELSDSATTFANKAAALRTEAESEIDNNLKASLLAEAEKYDQLATAYDSISNINFKLTGFANGGMEFTYPVKLDWERVVGGSDGFTRLLEFAKAESSKANTNLGIFPEFDFMYINNTSLFDGIGERDNVSKMLDNRYASKQSYNFVLQDYESFYTMVINPGALDRLYSEFENRYSTYKDAQGLSVSTLGKNLNSNFDDEDFIVREEAVGNVTALLDRMSSKYDIMLDTGNIYTLKYASHILNTPVDSSHLRYTSYTIPFVGMVLHGSLSYSGSALNQSGSPEYDILRSIENGAAPYYILSYANTAHMKENENLNQYYGVNYSTWYDSVIDTYDILNKELGALQGYYIVDHKVIYAERIISEEEQLANYETIKSELLVAFDTQVQDYVNSVFDDLIADDANIGRGIRLDIDRAGVIASFEEHLLLDSSEFDVADFKDAVDEIISKYETRYNSTSANPFNATFSAVEYDSSRFITNSTALDTNGRINEEYVQTAYTCNNDSVVLVTYSNGQDQVTFVLNYNIYSVKVNVDGTNIFEIGKYGFDKICS